ncbi:MULTISPECIES: helix-turn-helix domain-containing protein [Nonomuraea]|uniref:Helix-turn-helix transcriptional regulator n=1 Tax=Nonomuraea ferruginea TaxID=46174 RepID=A0ABT4T3K6_9ACTN|nr:helix-turn-helix transcriptional regulator [Nonomuraea ferruginea]MDA0644106.1 helix-turn-helix transcriptional regulator [Nonomuraea ferruginea]
MPPKELDPDAGQAARFGYELRKEREAKGMTQAQVGHRLGFAPTTIGAFELGTRRPHLKLAQACEELFRLEPGELVRWLPEEPSKAAPKWFGPWKLRERSARAIYTWEPVIVTGLLQTREYAEIILRARPGKSPSQVQEEVAARMERQAILTRDDPVLLWAFMDESILHRPIGCEAITRRQLEHLVEMSERPNITIQILPYSAMSAIGIGGAFALAQVPDEPDAAYIEGSLHGQIRDTGDDVDILKRRTDHIRSEVHSQRNSIEMIKKRLEEEWTWS